MARLIEELKKDHEALNSLLERVKDPRVSHKDAHQMLLSARASLLAHLKKEDTQLYPVLKKAAETDNLLKRTVDFYAKDMDEITAKAIKFFDDYSKPEARLDIVFAKDFGSLYATIWRRLRSEESTLYKEYEKLNP